MRTKAVKGAQFSLLSLLLGVICSPAVFCQGGEDSERVSINSNLVNLAVSVFSRKPGERVQDLKQSDFAVLDQGQQQQISFFESTAAPFDLVLLLDLSGSTREKLGLIKKSCARFVKAARPIDRIGIVTFTAET
ncbi:MAG: Ca-activated chloride channel, partial [Blastocatellia bacterium]|nr:Ca-activated chloride channel [Blastocatellia bacterium]